MPIVSVSVCLISISPHLGFLLWWQNFCTCLGLSKFKFLVDWVYNHQSYPTVEKRSSNRFPELSLLFLPGPWPPIAMGEMTKQGFECPLPRLICVTWKKRGKAVLDQDQIPFFMSEGLKASRDLSANSSWQEDPRGLLQEVFTGFAYFQLSTQGQCKLDTDSLSHGCHLQLLSRGWDSQAPWMRVLDMYWLWKNPQWVRCSINTWEKYIHIYPAKASCLWHMSIHSLELRLPTGLCPLWTLILGLVSAMVPEAQESKGLVPITEPRLLIKPGAPGRSWYTKWKSVFP